MDENLSKQKFKLGKALMDAFLLSMDTDDIYTMGDTLKQWIEDLDLPYSTCSECFLPMSFFNFHLKQGICDGCAVRLQKEYNDEEQS